MPLLNILQFPDPRLKAVALPVSEITEEIKTLAANMLDTMYETQGVGLAATQVNVAQRLMVIDISEAQNQPLVFINPEIITKKNIIDWEEGCLSFPGVYAKVKRAKEVEISFKDLEGQEQTLIATELLGVCIQHELDHLNGITFYDHLSPLKQELIRNKLEKMRRKSL